MWQYSRLNKLQMPFSPLLSVSSALCFSGAVIETTDFSLDTYVVFWLKVDYLFVSSSAHLEK